MFFACIYLFLTSPTMDFHSSTKAQQNRFSLVSYEYVNGESFRVYVDNNTKIEYLQTSTGMVMLKEKL